MSCVVRTFVGNFQWNLIEQEVRDLALDRWRHTSTMMLLAYDVQPRQILPTNLYTQWWKNIYNPSINICFANDNSYSIPWYTAHPLGIDIQPFDTHKVRFATSNTAVSYDTKVSIKNTHQTITTKWNKTNETVNSTSGSISLVNFPCTVYRLRSQRIISNAICRTIVAITGSGSMKTRPLPSKGLIPA